jgi:hypothetical protein
MSVRVHYRLKRRRLNKPEELISLTLYAETNHLDPSTVRYRIQQGYVVGFKIAGNWWIRPNPLPSE